MVDKDRVRGIMTGIAVGNLLGISMEGWRRVDILRDHPDGVREIEARSGYPDDDDLAQAIVIAEAANDGPLNVQDLGHRFWVWAEVNGAGIGGLTRDALALYGGDHPQRLARNRSAGNVRDPAGIHITEASKRAWRGYRAGNGALMRCAPLAIRWPDDSMRLVRESVVSAVPTHWDPKCGWSCALVNLAISGALRRETLSAEALLGLAKDGIANDRPELEHYGYEPEPPPSVVERLHEASRATVGDLQFDGRNMGYTLLSMQAALASYWRARNFETGLRQIVEAGGDTDTNGAIVGAILGARFGLGGIPLRWQQRVSEIRMGRIPMDWYADMLTVG